MTSREIQFKSLSALIFEVERLNTTFYKHDVPAKILLLCRTDLFERIPGANKNKIRQDFSVELDWYHDPNEPDQSLLVQIAQIRAMRSLGKDIDIFVKFFPQDINGISPQKYLLDMTRHTPRDFLRLLSHIQDFSSLGMISSNQIKSGLREYSIKYFLPEIKDELSGYATPEEIDKFMDVLSRLKKRDFSISEFISASSSAAKPLENDRIYAIFKALFQCSWQYPK